MKEYRVIKDIPKGWEYTARFGETLTVGKYMGHDALFNYAGDAICDLDSVYGKEHCVLVDAFEPNPVPADFQVFTSPRREISGEERERIYRVFDGTIDTFLELEDDNDD